MLDDTHIHKYQLIKFKTRVRGVEKSGYEILKCMHPDCTHHIAKPLGLGRRTICWVCGKPTVLDAKSINMKKPHCPTCTRFPNGRGKNKGKREVVISLTSIDKFLKRKQDGNVQSDD